MMYEKVYIKGEVYETYLGKYTMWFKGDFTSSIIFPEFMAERLREHLGEIVKIEVKKFNIDRISNTKSVYYGLIDENQRLVIRSKNNVQVWDNGICQTYEYLKI